MKSLNSSDSDTYRYNLTRVTEMFEYYVIWITL
jgi:hypothetical protein